MTPSEKHFGPVWFIPGENDGKYPFCHSFYIEGAGVLIDPASDRKRLEALREGPGVKEIWLSHWHEDHFMHLDLFDHLPLCVSERDSAPLSGLSAFMDAYGFEAGQRAYWQDFLLERFHFRPRRADRFLRPGETVDLGSTQVEIIGVPGHTPGNLAFFFKGPRALFMGDYDLSKFGPWYGDTEASIEETITSVDRLRRAPAKVWLTSHEQGIFEEEPDGLWDRYLDVVDQRENKLLSFLTEARTMADIVKACIVYRKPREPKAFFEFGERAIMGKHLERLIRLGKVEKTGEGYVKV